MVNKEDLIKFETEIGDMFNDKVIKSPIHLYNGNEEKMISVFNYINCNDDWICCTWRNHYQALLKGIPSELLKEYIIDGKSMVMNLPEYKFICSSIVGGIPSIATGIALNNKLNNIESKVWCWIGDMSSETSQFHEAYKYSRNHMLPITFIVESNDMSVLTPTNEVWAREIPYFIDNKDQFIELMNCDGIYRQPNLIYYKYKNNKYPHAGAGKRIQF